MSKRSNTYSEQMQDELEPIEPEEKDYHEQTLFEKMKDEEDEDA
tara:strand:+ start:3410 stop:3541 length:132 start_codon:yes stop_codon:yes gene_type:complete